MTLAGLSVAPTFNWSNGDSYLRPSDPDYLYPPDTHVPNAFSLILRLLQYSWTMSAYTYDQQALQFAASYPFLNVIIKKPFKAGQRTRYLVEVSRSAEDLPSIYRWLKDNSVKLDELKVPWIHPAHTKDTLGVCPYCEAALSHEEWQKHAYAVCLGGFSQLAGLGACQDYFHIGATDHRLAATDVLEDHESAKRLLWWKTLVKTVSGTYVCWERSDSLKSGPHFYSDLAVYVYGTSPNMIIPRRSSLRPNFTLGEPVPVGTIIRTTRELNPSLGYYWGVI